MLKFNSTVIRKNIPFDIFSYCKTSTDQENINYYHTFIDKFSKIFQWKCDKQQEVEEETIIRLENTF